MVSHFSGAGEKGRDLRKPSGGIQHPFPMILDLLLVHLLPFLFFMKQSKCPLFSGLFGVCLLRMSPPLLPQAAPSLLSFFLPFYHQLADFSLSEGHLCLCASGASVSGHMLPALLFHFPFPSEHEIALEERGFLSLGVCGARQQTRTLLGSWFSPHFTDEAYLEVRDCKLTAGIWPAGEWFSV